MSGHSRATPEWPSFINNGLINNSQNSQAYQRAIVDRNAAASKGRGAHGNPERLSWLPSRSYSSLGG
jgi:hypothetical protein